MFAKHVLVVARTVVQQIITATHSIARTAICCTLEGVDAISNDFRILDDDLNKKVEVESAYYNILLHNGIRGKIIAFSAYNKYLSKSTFMPRVATYCFLLVWYVRRKGSQFEPCHDTSFCENKHTQL